MSGEWTDEELADHISESEGDCPMCAEAARRLRRGGEAGRENVVVHVGAEADQKYVRQAGQALIRRANEMGAYPTPTSEKERWSGDTENFIRGLRQWMETAETRQDLVEVPVEVLLEAIDRLRGGEVEDGDRNCGDYYDFRRENDYEIHVSSGGVVVKAWYYEAPHSDIFGESTRVDPREVEPDGDVSQMIHLGLARVHTIMEEENND